MRSEFTWASDFPMPVEIERGVERSVKNRYDILMAVKSDGVNLFVKSQMAWTIARSEFGLSIPMVNYGNIRNSLGCGFGNCWISAEKYLDCLVKAGQIGWYRTCNEDAVWGFERNEERIKSIMGDDYKSKEEKLIDRVSRLNDSLNASESEVALSKDVVQEAPADDPFLVPESSESASSSEQPAVAKEDNAIYHKKSFMELMRGRSDVKR